MENYVKKEICAHFRVEDKKAETYFAFIFIYLSSKSLFKIGIL